MKEERGVVRSSMEEEVRRLTTVMDDAVRLAIRCKVSEVLFDKVYHAPCNTRRVWCKRRRDKRGGGCEESSFE